MEKPSVLALGGQTRAAFPRAEQTRLNYAESRGGSVSLCAV